MVALIREGPLVVILKYVECGRVLTLLLRFKAAGWVGLQDVVMPLMH